MNITPPEFPQRLLQRIAGPGAIDDLLGDLEELFHEELKNGSAGQAKFQYWRRCLSLMFSYAIRKRKHDALRMASPSSTLTPDMIANYLKVAARNLYHHKYFSFLNAFGLALGMSVSLLLIALYSFVRTYDEFHVNGQRIHSIWTEQRNGVEQYGYATAPLVLADKLEREAPFVKNVVRIIKENGLQVKNAKEDFGVDAYFVEPAFLSVFTFPLIQGSETSLGKPGQAMLTESAALKLFNTRDVVGKNIELADGTTLEVAGLLNDLPLNSHLGFEMLVSLSTIPNSDLSLTDRWTSYKGQYIYLLLRDEHNAETNLQRYLETASKEVPPGNLVQVTFSSQKLKDITMGPDLLQSIGKTWDIGGFIIFGVFAVLILLPACFNYTNISIARALRRSKEIGLRKTMGGAQGHIFFQFITETMVITFLALIGSVLIFVVIRDEFQSMLVAGASLDLSVTWKMAVMFIAFALLTGFLGGLFPALFFTRLNPIEALKNKLNSRGGTTRIRKGLTVFQFILSFGFILSLVVFGRQYKYSLNFDFGFQKQNMVNVELKDVNPALFEANFSRMASVKSISMSSSLPGIQSLSNYMRTAETDSVQIDEIFVDDNFIENFKLELLFGKNFPDKFHGHERFMIVNEQFLKLEQTNNPAEVLGKTYTIDGLSLEVIGVVKNFHYAPLRYPIDRLCLRMNPTKYKYANMSVTANDPVTMFAQMEKIWKTFPTEAKFKGRYFEEEMDEAFSTYKVLLKMVGFLGTLAISVSLLEMIGMVVYNAETKTKEVGIRKVMGASVASITILLSKDYLKMMALAIILSVPTTIFILGQLLPSLQYYHADITVWDVMLATVVLLMLGFITITSQTYKTATTNPATTLRSE